MPRLYPKTKTTTQEYNDLGTAGHTGSLNTRQFKFLRAEGFSGALQDMFEAFLRNTTSGPNSQPITINSMSFNEGGSGTQPSIDLNVSYAGDIELTAYFLVVTLGGTVTETELENGTTSGDGVEGFSAVIAAGSTSATISGLTSAIESGAEIHCFVKETGIGGLTDSAIVVDDNGGTGYTFDGTAPTASTGSTDATGAVFTIPISEAAFGSVSPSDVAISGISAGSPTIDSTSIVGSDLVVNISGNLPVGSDTLTFAYSGTGITDGVGIPLATFSGLSVTNNVASGPTVEFVEEQEVSESGGVGSSFSVDTSSFGDGDTMILFYGNESNTTGALVDGSATGVTHNAGTGQFGGRLTLVEKTFATAPGASVTVDVQTANNRANQKVIVYRSTAAVAQRDVDFTTGGGGPLSLTFTPTQSDSVAIAVIMGQDGVQTITPSGDAPAFDATGNFDTTTNYFTRSVESLSGTSARTYTYTGNAGGNDMEARVVLVE